MKGLEIQYNSFLFCSVPARAFLPRLNNCSWTTSLNNCALRNSYSEAKATSKPQRKKICSRNQKTSSFHPDSPALSGRGFFSFVSACLSLFLSNPSMFWIVFSWLMTAKWGERWKPDPIHKCDESQTSLWSRGRVSSGWGRGWIFLEWEGKGWITCRSLIPRIYTFSHNSNAHTLLIFTDINFCWYQRGRQTLQLHLKCPARLCLLTRTNMTFSLIAPKSAVCRTTRCPVLELKLLICHRWWREQLTDWRTYLFVNILGSVGQNCQFWHRIATRCHSR